MAPSRSLASKSCFHESQCSYAMQDVPSNEHQLLLGNLLTSKRLCNGIQEQQSNGNIVRRVIPRKAREHG